MEASPVELDPDLGELLEEMGRPPREAARELIVLGLYAQGEISSGSAAQLLEISRDEFIQYASQRGIPYFQMSPEELRREVDGNQSL
jgi:predicted HTH domain antitoxin